MRRTRDRELDLVLVGATGFVGRLTAHHLARAAPDGVRIGLAARSAGRLQALRETLGSRAESWTSIEVDLTDEPAVRALADRTSVLMTTVGPYLRAGLPLVRACAEAGTDYTDLTGETLFVRRSIDAADAAARASGARIVHSCGFDSIPADLGVGLTAARAARDGVSELTETVLHVRSMRGGISGGTVDSLRQQLIATEHDHRLRAMIARPTTLVDADHEREDDHESDHGRATGDRAGRISSPVRRDPATGRWQAPFVMGGYNRQIVLRSNELSERGYGPGFRYREVVDTGRGVPGVLAATGVTAGTTALLAGMAWGPSRALLDRVLPDPGQGPSDATRRRGRFALEVVAATGSGARYRTGFAAPYDPGYDGTAVMFAEAALALLLDDLAPSAGVLTPMIAIGAPLADRLRRHDFSIESERLAP